ncbi:response regulator [Massilia sp. H-1]|nr:response regulator [Massilia sp. H-1]
MTLDAGNSDSVDLHFSVRDTGIGIAPENIDHIFDGFSQAEASTARRFGGTGLGLAISQRLVQLMGGLLRVTSTPGRGSTFEFTITLGRTPQQSVREMNHALQYLRCLVVDDSPTGRDVLAAIVRSFGWRAEGVASGEEALAAVGTRPYDVVLMDWRMPGIDGWETSVRLRRQVPNCTGPAGDHGHRARARTDRPDQGPVQPRARRDAGQAGHRLAAVRYRHRAAPGHAPPGGRQWIQRHARQCLNRVRA